MDETYFIGFPPPPWRLVGDALLRLQRMPVARAREWVPEALSVVRVSPGHTLGGLFVARYEAGSTREYHELMAVAGLVRHDGRLGAWISHIWVDDGQSLRAGREIWGLPKQIARFAWQSTHDGLEVTVDSDTGTRICTLAAPRPRRRLTLPVFGPVIAQRDARLLAFTAKGRAKLSTGYCHIDIPTQSPLASLGLSGGRHLQLDDFALRLPKPARLHCFTE